MGGTPVAFSTSLPSSLKTDASVSLAGFLRSNRRLEAEGAMKATADHTNAWIHSPRLHKRASATENAQRIDSQPGSFGDRGWDDAVEIQGCQAD